MARRPACFKVRSGACGLRQPRHLGARRDRARHPVGVLGHQEAQPDLRQSRLEEAVLTTLTATGKGFDPERVASSLHLSESSVEKT